MIKDILKGKKGAKFKPSVSKILKGNDKENVSICAPESILWDTANIGLLPPKKAEAPKYTLVLDMDETLIHFVNALDESKFEVMEDDDLCFFVRPGVF